MNRYRKSYTVKVGTVMLSTLLLLGSCSEDAIIDDNGGKLGAASDNICFGISDNDGWPETRSAHTTADEVVTGNFVLRSADNADTLCVQTTVCDFGPLPFGNNAPTSRAALVSEANMHGSFGVTACLTKDNSYLFFNEENRKPDNYNPSAIWSYVSGNIYYWPGEAHPLKFYAYSPYGCEGLTPPAQPDKGNAAPSFSYTVPVDAANQTDLLAYATEEMSGATNSSVPLSFQHICTAVQFVVGKEMQPGTIKTIRLKGIKNSGTYSFDTDWTLDGTTADFEHNLNKGVSVSTSDDTEKENITDDTDCFIMLPQTLPDGASVEIVFHDNTTGTDRTLTASITGQEWPQGKRVKYNISILPDYELEFTSEPEAQDAHYVICKTTVHSKNLPEDKTWGMKATASDGADVSIQLERDVNDAVKQGFWTDKIMKNGVTSTESARGSSTFEGAANGDVTVYVFIPENTSDNENRIVTLELTVGGNDTGIKQTITQHHPAWTNGFGWEQIDDNQSGQWGFYSNKKTVYVYHNSEVMIPSNRNKVENMIKNLINEYNASEYVSWGRYVQNIGYRWWVAIDYSKLNILKDIASSSLDGFNNTKQLYNFGGTALSNTFEEALTKCVRIHDSSTKAFRLRGADPTDVPESIDDNSVTNPILPFVLKKNRYYLNRFEDSTSGIKTEAPLILEKDIVWYLPAYGQFNNLPTDIETSVTPSEDWSSTASNESDKAYLGDSNTASRISTHKIRACRNRP